jgi:sec-independent protein translocase protein TatB
MFGIGSTELLVILLVALIVLGPKNLAGISRTLGKAMGEFRRVSTEFQRTLNVEAAREDEAQRKKEVAPHPSTDASASPVGQAVAKAKDEAQKTDVASTDEKA